MTIANHNPTLPKEAVERCTGQKRRILAMLRNGPVTNTELVTVAQRFGARLQELREHLRPFGWVIETNTVDNARGVFRYSLKREGGAS